MAGPWGPLSAQTRGFLSLLGIKNTGRNPGQLLDDVRPVVEMQPWYLQGSARNSRSTSVGFVAPISGIIVQPFVVPEGEIWYVHDLGGYAYNVPPDLSGPTQVLGFSAFAGYPNPASDLLGPQRDYFALVPTIPSQVIPVQSMRDFWAPAGTALGLWAGYIDIQNALSATNFGTVTSIRYTPMVV